MTAAVSVNAPGLPRLQRALRAAADDLADLGEANQATAALVASTATGRAPRRTGRLAASVRPATGAGWAGVEVSAPYAAPVHWGVPSRGQEAQPFVTDAASATEGAWQAIYAAELQRIADRAGGTY